MKLESVVIRHKFKQCYIEAHMKHHGDFYGMTAPKHLWASSELIVSFLKIKAGEDVWLKIKRTYVYYRAEGCLAFSLFVQMQ